MTSPSFWEPKGSRQICFLPKEWASTYSELGKFQKTQGRSSTPKPKRVTDIRGDLATPPRDPKGKALTHKLWAREFLQSTFNADMTNIVQHAMCGVTNSLLKHGSDPRKVLHLAEQLHHIALARANEGRVKEAHVALKQAKAMGDWCMGAINRGDGLKRTVGHREVAVTIVTPKSVHGEEGRALTNLEHEAREFIIRVTCDLVDLSVKTSAPGASNKLPARVMSAQNRTRRSTEEKRSTRRSSTGSSPLITMTLHEPSARPDTQRGSTGTDYLYGQIPTSPIPGHPDSNRYLTSSKKAFLKASNEALRQENKALRVTRQGTSWVPLPSQRPPVSDKPDDLQMHIDKQRLYRQLADANSYTTFSVKFGDKGVRQGLEQALGNTKMEKTRQPTPTVLQKPVVKALDGW